MWPASARRLVGAVLSVLAAARAADADGFTAAVAELGKFERFTVELVLGSTLRSLLEEQHPDGLAGDDARDLLQRTVRSASSWCEDVDVDVMILVLTGSLGVHEVDEAQRQVAAADFARAASLLAGELLSASEQSADGYVYAAVGEIARAETMEMP